MNIFHQLSVFLVGFIIGFVTVFLYKYVDFFDSSKLANISINSTWNVVKKWSESSENYRIWRQNQNILITKVNLDALAYDAQESNKNYKIVLESEWLKNKIPITCIVFVEKLKFAIAIKDTWGKYCNHLIFFSKQINNLDLPVINLEIKYTSSWQLLCEVLNYIWKKRDEISLHWIIFVNDDTLVIPENLRYMLAPLDYNQPYYLGHAVVLWGLPYNVAQAGYVLSYEVLRRLMTVFDTSQKCAAGGKYWKKEDYYLAKHLQSFGIHPLDTRDSEQRATFHGFSLNTLQWGVARPGSYYTRALYQPGLECCSNKTITFTIGEADQMRTISYILYQLRILHRGKYGNKAAPTSMPENEVWRSALREEFNLTITEEISSDEYFKIWREKYSEPEHFIAIKFRKMPELIKSFLTADQSNVTKTTLTD